MPPTQHRATGVEYRELIPEFLAFDCKPLRATISPASCAARWASAESGSSCHGCAIGAQHAGQTPAPPPPVRLPCLRCGSTEQRLIARTICVSCFNRQRELENGRNAKGSFPMSAGRRLRFGYAILRLDGASAALHHLYKTTTTSTAGWRSGLRAEHLPGLPKFERLERDALFFSSIVTGRDELERIVARLLPGAAIEDAEFSETFTEKHLRATDTNIRMGHSATPTRQGFPGNQRIISTNPADYSRVVTPM